MFSGVQTPWKKVLELNGVGYRVEVRGNEIVLNVGFSHPVALPVPAGPSPLRSRRTSSPSKAQTSRRSASSLQKCAT
jgi:ribosomal protein L6P/L9E